MDAIDESCPRMREGDAPARERQADLAGMKMAGEDQVERADRQPPRHAGEMAEQEAERGVRVGSPLRRDVSAR